MSHTHREIVVVGAGVLGLSVAAELTTRGRDVRVVDPGGVNASAVAAGMIAPAFESVLDGVDAERATLLRQAAALWPEFAARHGVALDLTPAEWRGDDVDGVASRLEELGFSVERTGDRVRAPEDVRVEPEAALAALRTGLIHPVIVGEALSIGETSTGWRVETTGGSIDAEAVVIATGAAAAIVGLPDPVAAQIGAITPIAGQIGRCLGPDAEGVLRRADGYVVPADRGVLIGATMVSDSRDASPDARASVRLAAAAERLLGRPLDAGIDWRGGVRGATADGLPMAGPVGGGLHLALAPRRNGWLLGPLVGRIVADGIEGRPRGPHAAALDPLRPTLPAG